MNEMDWVIPPRLGALDHTEEAQRNARLAASVDGADGPTAHAVLAPAGLWLPALNPLLVKQVRFEVNDDPNRPYTLHFDSY